MKQATQQTNAVSLDDKGQATIATQTITENTFAALLQQAQTNIEHIQNIHTIASKLAALSVNTALAAERTAHIDPGVAIIAREMHGLAEQCKQMVKHTTLLSELFSNVQATITHEDTRG